MKPFALVLTLAATGCTVGCMVGPDYRPPATQPPSQWSEPLAGGETGRSADLTAWWRGFRDPELDSLVQRALRANLDLRIAQARVREARAERGLADAGLWPRVDLRAPPPGKSRAATSPCSATLLPPGTPLTSNVYQGGFDASWELDLFGGDRRGVEAADADLAAAGFSRADAQVTPGGGGGPELRAARGYQQRLAIARQNLTAQRDIVALARDRYRRGSPAASNPSRPPPCCPRPKPRCRPWKPASRPAIHHLGVLLGQAPGRPAGGTAQAAPMPPRRPKCRPACPRTCCAGVPTSAWPSASWPRPRPRWAWPGRTCTRSSP